MTKVRSAIVVGSVALFAAAAVVANLPAQQPAGGDKLRLADREEIRELMWKYTRALDTFNADAYAATFTKDGSFTTTKGTDALKKMITGIKDGREKRAAGGESVAGLYHMNADTWIEFVDATHARHHTYWLTLTVPTGKGAGEPKIIQAGRAIDHLVKVDGKWLIEHRDISPKGEK